jgi:structural maintenance of chromosomes protein 6
MARGSQKRRAQEAVAKEDEGATSPKRAALDARWEELAAEEAGENEEKCSLKVEDNEDANQEKSEEANDNDDDDDAVEAGNEKSFEGTKEGEEEDQGMEEQDHEKAEDAAQVGDDDEDSVENNDNDEDEAPRSIKRQINVAGKPAEAGIIKSIYLENFMCHPKLTLELCRNVNFINGQNGSGKSAILAGIQICLGASSKRTNRARNLKGLVRKEAAGKNPNTSAKCRVTLLNGGGDAYKPELYGDTITIERHISLKGGYNGYKLLDANNREVSKSKKDLDEMLDYLNIQVDNPVAILSQEDAKKFLQGKAEDKYRFFMQATELERIDRTFAAAMDQKDELHTKKAALADSMTAKLELVRTLQQKVDEFQVVEKLQKKRLDTEVDYAWAFYAERNADYEETAQVSITNLNLFSLGPVL